jgi:secreted PhoX family phosphatase
MLRRQFLRWSAAGACGIALGASFWRNAFAAPAIPGPSPYGPLASTPDASGLRLPEGFTSRLIAVSGLPVHPTGHRWHFAPDGGACFPMADGGWVYTSNSELPLIGGAAMIRFNASGNVIEARPILSGTHLNCAGGPTPWGTWLSCEEFELGHVWECYLDGQPPELRSDLGTFTHEAVAVDPVRKRLYLTEDEDDGRFYRHIPGSWPNLDSGRLYAANVSWDNAARLSGSVRWFPVPDEVSARAWPMRTYTTAFNGGEGCWYDSGLIYFATKGDNRIWSYDAGTRRLEVIYDANLHADSPLRGVDNIVVSKSRDIFVAEDGDNMQICLITPDRLVAPFLELEGHDGSEITGPAFNPVGDRLYFSSQRGRDRRNIGMTFQVRGPFRS